MKRKPNYKLRNCRECGIRFAPLNPKQSLCGSLTQKMGCSGNIEVIKKDNAARARKRRNSVGKMKKCKRCGIDFVTNVHGQITQLYCGSRIKKIGCGWEVKKEQHFRMYKNWYAKKYPRLSHEQRSFIQSGIAQKLLREGRHPLWKGGITPINHQIRASREYKLWRKAVFERDDFTCQRCGERGGKLNADHIKSFAEHPEIRTELSNGRTLCVECHKLTPTYLNGVYAKKSKIAF